MIQKRSIGLVVVLSIVTCGIYLFYWMMKMTDEVNQLSGETGATSGGMVVLLTLITGGIYYFFWNGHMAKRIAKAQEKAGIASKDNSTLYLILLVCGLEIVTLCMIQADINTMAQ